MWPSRPDLTFNVEISGPFPAAGFRTMDPFTLTTGVGSFISLSVELVKILKEYVTTVNSAPTEVQMLLTDVSSLSQVFQQLEKFLKKMEYNSIFRDTSILCSVLRICDEKIKTVLSRLYKFRSSGGMRDRWRWPFQKQECMDIAQTLHHCAQTVQLSLTISNGELLSQTSQELTTALTERNDSILKVLHFVSGIDSLASDIHQVKNDLLQLKQDKNNIARCLAEVRAWLSPLEPQRRHHDIKSNRINNTGEWVLDTDAYKAWFNRESKGDPQHQILSLYGMPGAGKTFIASTIIDYLSATYSGSRKTGVAYVYCDYRDQQNQTVTNIIGSIVYQLLEVLEYHEITFIIRNVEGVNLEECIKKRKRNSSELALKLLRLVLRKFAQTFICLDAVDELDRDTQLALMKSVKEIFNMPKTLIMDNGNSHGGVFLCFTARPHIKNTIVEALGKQIHSVNITANYDDIRKYILHQLDVDPDSKVMNDVLKQQILTKIPKNSQGMFLLAALQIQVVLQELTIAKRKAATQSLPKDLSTAYSVSLERIQTSPGPVRELGMKVLMWTHLAQYNLRLEELLHALAVEVDDSATDLDEDNIPLDETILSCCKGLVVIDHESSEVRLVHYSLQEFFKIHGSEYFPYGHRQIAQTCLTYLNFKPLLVHCTEQDELEHLATKYKLLKYAATQWGHHAFKQIDSSVERLALHLLELDRAPAAIQYCFRGPILFSKTKSSSGRIAGLSKCGIHLATAFGLETIVRSLLCTEANSDQCTASLEESIALVNSQDPYLRTPLSHAAFFGHEHLVSLLIRQPHINVNPLDEDQSTPLSLATRKGHESVVRLLLKHPDIDVNAGTPLSEACNKGNENLIRLMLQHPKIDLYAGTPLAKACKSGNENIIRIFLKEPDFVDPNIGTPLAEACKLRSRNPEEIVRLLLEHPRTNINARLCSDFGHVPLFYAAEQGHDRVVQLLLEQPNIDINARAFWEDSPLSTAVERGHERVVELLLSHANIDVNIPASYRYEHTSLLSAAVIAGHYGVFRLLLQHPNIDINERDFWGDSPLSWAAEKGHENMVRDLLEKPDIDVNTQTRFWDTTPLLRAVQRGHEGVVRLLLAHPKINIDLCDSEGKTALAVAIDRGEEGIIELLDIDGGTVGGIAGGNSHGNRKRVFEEMMGHDHDDGMDISSEQECGALRKR